VLRCFALHHETNEPLPEALLQSLLVARQFNQGFATIEYTASALVDLALHLPSGVDIVGFEKTQLDKLGMPASITMRHRTPHFQHVFSGESYAAGYYSYLWSEVLDADGFEASRSGAIFSIPWSPRSCTTIFIPRASAVTPTKPTRRIAAARQNPARYCASAAWPMRPEERLDPWGRARAPNPGLTREVAEQGGAMFFVPSGLFSPFDASVGGGGAPEVDGGETFYSGRRERARDRGAVRWRRAPADRRMGATAWRRSRPSIHPFPPAGRGAPGWPRAWLVLPSTAA